MPKLIAAKPIDPLKKIKEELDKHFPSPPKGTITVTSPQSGETWWTGGTYKITWTCNGTRSNLVNLSLWKDNNFYATLGEDVGSGRSSYKVPFELFEYGDLYGKSCEIRVTDAYDPRVEGRQPIIIKPTTVTVATPDTDLLLLSTYTISWTYEGHPGWLEIRLKDPNHSEFGFNWEHIHPGVNGIGTYDINVPGAFTYFGKSSERYRITIRNEGSFKLLGESDAFIIRLPVIHVAPMPGPYSPGSQYQIIWSSELNGKNVNVELFSLKKGAMVQVISGNHASQAINVINWSPPANLASTLYGTSFEIRITSTDYDLIQGSSNQFVISKP